ncbi:MAG TPA: hypothetical protein VJ840_18550 [Gemmatimonadaceae bacterium]|nr:hypothetical protein [Gemmatimonadaceae bacterium]
MGYHGVNVRSAVGGSGDAHPDSVAYNPHQLYGIAPEQVDAVWPKVAKWLDGSAESTRGKYTADDIKDGILSGHAQLWLYDSPTAFGVLVTVIAEYPQNRCCVIKIGTGENAEEWWDLALTRLEDFGRHAGCDAMEILCRPGWVKRFKSRGYDYTHAIMEKRL